jgi:hypothetical protein
MNSKLIMLFTAVISASTVAVAVNAPRTPHAIPSLEGERTQASVSKRGDTGRLTREALAQQQAAVSTRSSIFTIENVTAPRVDLPITGDRARIAVASDTDRDLDVRLDGPAGVELATTSFGRTGPSDASNQKVVVQGRGDVGRGALLVSDERAIVPGTYALTIRRSNSPVQIYVNDVGGPELILRLSETACDDRQPVTLNAELRDGRGPLTGADITARIGTEDCIRLVETAPGNYSATIVPSEFDLNGTARVSVRAEGRTRDGLRLLRNGDVDLITARAHAEVVEVSREELTETDLVVPIRIRVTAPGRFHARANLLGLDGDPIAWAQDARDLPIGEHVLTLRFDRTALGEHGSDFELSNLRVMDVTAIPGITVPGTTANPRLVYVSGR